MVDEVHDLARSLASGATRCRRLFLDTTGDGKNDFAARQLASSLSAERLSLARFAPESAHRTDAIASWLLEQAGR